MSPGVLKSAVAAVTILVISGASLGVHSIQVQANRGDRTGQPRLAESITCRGLDGHDPSMGAPSSAKVLVRPTVLLRVDSSGQVIAAATNTGCAPRRGDDVYFVGPDGTETLAPADEIDDCEWTGDFVVPGRFQPQQCHARPTPSGPPHRRYSQPS